MKFKNHLLALGALVGLVCLPSAFAEMVATPLPGDSRLVQFEYHPDQTFLILSKPKAVTNIEFGDDEKITTVAAGDSKNWELTPTANKKHLFVKPIYDQIETSMTVLTDKRSYQFVLRSTGQGSKWYQRVTWRRDQTMLLDLGASVEAEKRLRREAEIERQASGEAFSPEKMNFGYQITGDGEFRPLAVFDDGRFTWIKLPMNLQEMPALFATVPDGDFQLVNYLVKGDYIVAQRLIKAGVLKLGKSEVHFVQTGKAAASTVGFWN